MQCYRDEFGHVSKDAKAVPLSQHIEPEPRCSGGRTPDLIVVRQNKLELREYIQHLRNEYELNGSLEFY